LGHWGLIISDVSYSNIAPLKADVPTFWGKPNSPGRAPSTTDGTSAHISRARRVWEEDVQTYQTYTSVQQALKKQIINVFEPMFLEIFNNSMVGYANISARYMLDHLFDTYGNITAVDLEIKFEHMRQAWDPQQSVETLFKQIQDCADYSETGGKNRSVAADQRWACKKMFATGHFVSACLHWNEKPAADKLGLNLNPTSQPHTVSTSKCRDKALQTPDIIQLTPP
jgi:hypothetical protein